MRAISLLLLLFPFTVIGQGNVEFQQKVYDLILLDQKEIIESAAEISFQNITGIEWNEGDRSSYILSDAVIELKSNLKTELWDLVSSIETDSIESVYNCIYLVKELSDDCIKSYGEIWDKVYELSYNYMENVNSTIIQKVIIEKSLFNKSSNLRCESVRFGKFYVVNPYNPIDTVIVENAGNKQIDYYDGKPTEIDMVWNDECQYELISERTGNVNRQKFVIYENLSSEYKFIVYKNDIAVRIGSMKKFNGH